MYNFIPIIDSNIKEASLLTVASGQLNSVETVLESYNDAKEISIWRPMMVTFNDLPTGFVMHGEWIYEDLSNRVWMDRFLTDHRHQSQGHAHRLIPLVIDLLRNLYSCSSIYLSVYSTYSKAIKLY